MEHTSKQYYHELIHEMKRYPDSMPYAWLSAKFSQLHLDVFVHNFSLIYPFQEQKVQKQQSQSQMIHVMRCDTVSYFSICMNVMFYSLRVRIFMALLELHGLPVQKL